MSEGTKSIAVTSELECVLLQEQLSALGIEAEVTVNQPVCSSIVQGLLALPATQERMKKILAGVDVDKSEYCLDFVTDGHTLLDNIAAEFRKFSVRYPKTLAMRDGVIGRLTAELGLIGLEERRETPVEDIIPAILTEVLQELKGIKEAVTPATVKVDLGAEARMAMDPRLKEFLSKSGPVGIAGFVDGLRSYINAVADDEKPVAELNDWLDFVFKNPDILKRQMQTFECRPVHTKEELIRELTAALTGGGMMQLFPMVLAANLSAKDAEEVLQLLHPKQTFVFGGELEGASPASADMIIETLLSALREEVPSDVHLCGLSALRAQERVILIDKLEQGTDKYTSKVAGGSKRTLLEGLVNALQGDIRFTSRIVIRGLGVLTPEDVTALTNLFKVGLQDTTEFVDSQSPDEHVLDKLTEIFGGDDTNSIVLHNLKGMPGEDKRYIYTSLLTAVKKYQELKRIKKEFLVNGDRAFKGDNKPANLTFTLSELGQKWVREAAGYGIAIDPLILISHLFGQMGLHGGIETGAKIFRTEPTTMTLTNVAGASIKLGNHTFERNEDGSLKILTDVNGKSNTVILNTDGGVMLHGPGYMG